ncbi:MAG: ligase-associated DNA damage response exonuclease [Ignavibacteria bacterium]|nr:ligase-associated DNA damage response exonuclease [Ignavibacteria bacterium]MBK6418877.1 ligase-associated DNA damage response exonuclease [Ignavibacteria bacterium]MBK6760429.1 ligase-associated DNA damage response exonuclease [Ignavibacteria bacterium]MBK7186841.1 ligase-associated DNA damage response exonuclease [Ignavibacteria bacterium]MBK7411783.1 ligase-associated DNA damage response exonuclease [Ignavibacteria bacterium]
MGSSGLLTLTDRGLYCERGDFYIDPQRSVERAVITHAHSDHARPGMKHYLAHRDTVPLLHHRISRSISTQAVEYGEVLTMHDVSVSFFPAGHMIGSAQIRVEADGEVWVVSGDYKRQRDPYAAPFQPLRCDTFITESTFGLPIYHWPSDEDVVSDIKRWHAANASCGIASAIQVYSLGKAQRLIGLLAHHLPLAVSAGIHAANVCIRTSGIEVAETSVLSDSMSHEKLMRGLILAAGPNDLRTIPAARSAGVEMAFASGWTATEPGRRRNSGAGFVISDHVDWDDLHRTIDETEAEHIIVTHGFASEVVQYLRERGRSAEVLTT